VRGAVRWLPGFGMEEVTEEVQAYVDGIVAYEAKTRGQFASLYRADVTAHPVPFFGNISKAVLLTVGVNPSATEFVGRNWPQRIPSAELAARLHSYFDGAPVPPHPWFEAWEQALASLRLSYRAGLAHLDLSPRATISMGALDPAAFSEMVEQDVESFFGVLPLCREARGLVLAGCVTKRWYAHRFLQRVAPRFGFALSEKSATAGPAKTSLLRLTGPDLSLPVFFCSVSPSARQNRELLSMRVSENAATIRTWLSSNGLARGSTGCSDR
jgi:hypothetical protein